MTVVLALGSIISVTVNLPLELVLAVAMGFLRMWQR
jgi:hypothetical protein